MARAKSTLLVVFCSMALSSSGFVACVNDADAAQRAGNFLTNPSSLAPSVISADVRDLVAANPQSLGAVVEILKNLMKDQGTTSDKQAQIGKSLALAAGLCTRPDTSFAAQIQTQLAGVGSDDANTEDAKISGNKPIRAVAAGGLGGGPGSSGSVGGQTTPVMGFQTFTANSMSNSSSNYFTGGVSEAGSAGSNTTTITIVCAVSTTC